MGSSIILIKGLLNIIVDIVNFIGWVYIIEVFEINNVLVYDIKCCIIINSYIDYMRNFICFLMLKWFLVYV